MARWCGLVFHTQAEKDERETRILPETQEIIGAKTSIAKRHPAINTRFRELFLQWSRIHSIARCTWNTLQKVPDVCKEWKQHLECNYVQPAAQHNDVMVKKQATAALQDVACRECGNATIATITTAKCNS